MWLYELENSIRRYEWGSTQILQDLLGVPSDGIERWAELWIGAHSRAPSVVKLPAGRRPLGDWIAESPEAILGEQVARRFNNALPFLLKVLATERPLSLQAHPNRSDAQSGFRREEAAGIPSEDPKRNFSDSNHKPELICAVTPFSALCGFRPPDEREELVAPLACGELVDSCWKQDDPLAFLFEIWNRTSLERREIARLVVSAASARVKSAKAYHWVSELGRLYPGDVGCLAPLFLQLVELQPGDALFLAPGILHSHLCGAGIELMANSDNVLRAGLTDKHVDHDSLLAILDRNTTKVSVSLPSQLTSGCWRYTPPVDEFELLKIETTPERPIKIPGGQGVEIALCWNGNGEILVGSEKRAWTSGSVFLIAGTHPGVTVSGSGTLYIARVAEVATEI